jgi:hypothetical protein
VISTAESQKKNKTNVRIWTFTSKLLFFKKSNKIKPTSLFELLVQVWKMKLFKFKESFCWVFLLLSNATEAEKHRPKIGIVTDTVMGDSGRSSGLCHKFYITQQSRTIRVEENQENLISVSS